MVQVKVGFRRFLLGGVALALVIGAVPAQAGRKFGRPASADAVSSYLAGRIAQGAGDWDQAARHLSEVLKLDPANHSLMRRAFLLHLGEGNYVDALDLARRLDGSGTDSFLASTLLVVEDLKQGRLDAARGRIDRLPGDGLGQYVAPLLSAWAKVAAGDHDGGLAALNPLEEAPGFTALLQAQRAIIEDLRNNEPAAADAFAKAMEGGPSLRLVQLVGNFHERRGRAEAARVLYLAQMAEGEDSPALQDALARLDAKAPAKRMIAGATDGLAEALFDVAAALHQESAQEMALLYSRVSLHLRPDQAMARMLAGDVLAARKRHEEALAEYRAVSADPGLAWTARLRQADTLRRLGRTDEATALLTTMAAERPKRTDALFRLGDAHRIAGNDAAAVDAYSQALARLEEKDSDRWSLLYARAMSLDAAGRWTEAERDLKRALELNPDQPQLLNFLGYSWIDRGLRLEEARRMVERAVELRPDDGYIVDSLGWAKFRIGDYHGAIQDLERAVELRPFDATINDHLGDAYWAVGRKQEARFQWKRAATLAEEDADLRAAAEDKLKNGLALPKTAETSTQP